LSRIIINIIIMLIFALFLDLAPPWVLSRLGLADLVLSGLLYHAGFGPSL